MKKLLLITIVIAVIAITGCSLFGSAEAAIISFSVEGIVGTAEIDPVTHSVTVTVEPMDISSIDPVITVSEKALLTEPESIEDGVAATYTVTAENGDVVEWTVTVNVQYGISFVLDGTKVIFTHGFKDSSDSAANAAEGNGVPGIAVLSESSESYVFEEVYDWGVTIDAPTFDYIDFGIGLTTGLYNDISFTYNDFSEESNTSYSCDFTVTEFGSVGGLFRASFSGTEMTAENRAGESVLSGGYAKLLVIETLGFPQAN